MNAVEVTGLSKSYPLEDSQWARFRHVFHPGRVEFQSGLWALRNVSFSVGQGEAFGIVGANGSGKSTLLQIVAGILRPTSGEVAISGRLSALLELGSGFSPEFTGRENVFLNASILGFTQEQTEQRFEAIEKFASIGAFIDQPIRTYSSGMVLRLAFAVSAHIDPEILIVDEALAVGDIAFRQRCMRRIHDLRAGGATILYVSHDIGDVKALCERCVWLDRGEVRALGESDEVIAEYLSTTVQRPANSVSGNPLLTSPGVPALKGGHRYGDGRARITHASLASEWMVKTPVALRVGFSVHQHLSSPIAGFLLRNAKGETIFGSNTLREDYPLSPMQPGEIHTIVFHLTPPPLASGRYLISVAIGEGHLDDFTVCDYVEDAIPVDVHSAVRGYMGLRCLQTAVHRIAQT